MYAKEITIQLEGTAVPIDIAVSNGSVPDGTVIPRRYDSYRTHRFGTLSRYSALPRGLKVGDVVKDPKHGRVKILRIKHGRGNAMWPDETEITFVSWSRLEELDRLDTDYGLTGDAVARWRTRYVRDVRFRPIVLDGWASGTTRYGYLDGCFGRGRRTVGRGWHAELNPLHPCGETTDYPLAAAMGIGDVTFAHACDALYAAEADAIASGARDE